MERQNTMVETGKILPFPGYPFRIVDDDEMQALVESIMLDGIHTPVVVRSVGEDSYEMISGHRRLFAALQIRLDAIPAEVKRVSDEEAAIAMVDAGLQREDLLPSEKAFAYRMRYDAMRAIAKRPGKRRSYPVAEKGQLDIALAKEVGESRGHLHRYLRLVHVIPAIRELVDQKAIFFFVHLFEYDSIRDIIWNVVGNAAMFIPSGIVLPIIYGKLDGFGKVVAGGALISLCIEILQLPFASRASDVDDLVLNGKAFRSRQRAMEGHRLSA